jgi:trehalose/maltose hydrolase-like predicted phosphorylase
MDMILGRDRTQRSQVVKQADVIALMALLPEEFDLPTKVANFRYYEPRCAHGSSLSRAMHAIVAARLGETDLALRYFRETAATDLTDTAGGSAGGVHIAALGGLWQAALFGFAGLSLRADVLALDPRLPPSWRSFGFRAHWRGRVVKVRVDQDSQLLAATLEAGEPMTLVVSEEPHALRPRDTLRIGFPASGEAGASL